MLYKRKNIWHYDFTVAGQRHRGTTKQESETKARQIESMLIAQASERGSIVPRKAPRLIDFAPRFLAWVKESRLSGGTKRYYHFGWRLLKQQDVAGMVLTAIANDVVQAMRIPGSASCFNKAVRTLHRILSKAEEWKVIARAPRLHVIEENERTNLITPAIETKLLAVAQQPLRDVLVIIQDSGMRPAEIFRMRAEEILWDKGVIFVPFGKRGKKSRRYVPLTARVAAALGGRLDGRIEGWVFPSKRAGSGHIETVNKQWLEARQQAGIPQDVVLYCGRHTFATEVYARTGNLKIVMEVMGHHQEKTAMRYQHPELEAARDAIELRNATSQITSQTLESGVLGSGLIN